MQTYIRNSEGRLIPVAAPIVKTAAVGPVRSSSGKRVGRWVAGPGRPRKPVDLQRVRELRREGKSILSVARMLGVSYDTIRDRLRE